MLLNYRRFLNESRVKIAMLFSKSLLVISTVGLVMSTYLGNIESSIFIIFAIFMTLINMFLAGVAHELAMGVVDKDVKNLCKDKFDDKNKIKSFSAIFNTVEILSIISLIIGLAYL